MNRASGELLARPRRTDDQDVPLALRDEGESVAEQPRGRAFAYDAVGVRSAECEGWRTRKVLQGELREPLDAHEQELAFEQQRVAWRQAAGVYALAIDAHRAASEPFDFEAARYGTHAQLFT